MPKKKNKSFINAWFIESIMDDGLKNLKRAHDFFDDEMSPDAELKRAAIIKKCRAILKEHGDLG